MLRFVLLLLLVAVVWWLVRRAGRSTASPPPPPPHGTGGHKPDLPHDTMVACAFCQVHLPRGEAVWQGEQAFCGEAHRLSFLKTNPPP